jgi:hypothetical protein
LLLIAVQMYNAFDERCKFFSTFFLFFFKKIKKAPFFLESCTNAIFFRSLTLIHYQIIVCKPFLIDRNIKLG